MVALHPEGVDRNAEKMPVIQEQIKVALHPEGVDRNRLSLRISRRSRTSPSTRRAWIEIVMRRHFQNLKNVALHPEGVDRNRVACAGGRVGFGSPSTRRAWIEINLHDRTLFMT